MAIVGRAKYTRACAKFRGDATRARVCILPAPQSQSPKLETTRSLISMLSDSFKDAAEQEMEMLVKLEQIRHKEILEHEIRMKELDNVRRREERQHEQFERARRGSHAGPCENSPT